LQIKTNGACVDTLRTKGAGDQKPAAHKNQTNRKPKADIFEKERHFDLMSLMGRTGALACHAVNPI
jgi:hypothetical protein